ncbi:MAG: hypothetical protein H8E93_02035 [Synechococcus sp.]|nr:hypothetical protein [Synechococcus sp.]
MGWFLRRFSLTKAVPLAIGSGTTAQVEHLELTFGASAWSLHDRATTRYRDHSLLSRRPKSSLRRPHHRSSRRPTKGLS